VSRGYNSRAVQAPDEQQHNVICGRCAMVCDMEDNFCRQCGMALSDRRLPIRREARLPALRTPRVPAVVARGVVVVAAGTIAELLAKRIVRSATTRVANVVTRPAGRKRAEIVPLHDDSGAQFISDTLFVRRIRVRR